MSANKGAIPGFSNASQPITPKIGTGYEITGEINLINNIHFKKGTKFKIFKEDSDGTYVTHLITNDLTTNKPYTANNIRLTKEEFELLKPNLTILPDSETTELFRSRNNTNTRYNNLRLAKNGGRRRYCKPNRKNSCKKRKHRKTAKRKGTRRH
jgi:hypothetical protein